MATKVFNPAAQVEVELPPEVAEPQIRRGEVAVKGKQIVTKGDRVLEIDASRLGEALDDGWILSDEETADKVVLRREETDAASLARGAVEAIARPLTFGLSDQAITAIEGEGSGERLGLRREGLGAVGTGTEIASGLAGGLAGVLGKGAIRLLGGGASAAAVGGTKVGQAAAKLIPAAATGRVAETARVVLPTAAGGAFEGYVYGAGNEFTESAIGEREISAEKMLLEDGMMGALIGGSIPAVMTGASRIASGARALPKKAAVDVLENLPERRSTVDSVMDTVLPSDANTRRWGAMTGTNEEALVQLKGFATTPEKRALAVEAMNDYDGVLDRTSREVVSNLESVNSTLLEAVEAATGANKYKRVDSLMPKDSTFNVRGMTREALLKADALLEKAQLKGLSRPGSYVMNDLDAARERINQALNEIDDATEIVMRDRPGTKGRPLEIGDDGPILKQQRKPRVYEERPNSESSNIASFEATNRAKQAIDFVRFRRRGVRSPDVQDTDSVIREANDILRTHLEDERVFSGGAVLQKETNAAYHAMKQAEEQLGTKNTVLGRMLDPNTPVQPGDALALAKQYGRITGEAKVGKIDAVLDTRLAYLEAVRKNFDLTPEQLATHTRAVAAVKQYRAALASKAEYSDFLTILGKVRNDGSGPSINAFSSVGSIFGLAAAGPIGLLAGRALSSPYTTLRTLIGIAHYADKASLKIDGAVGRMIGGLRPTSPGTKRISPRSSIAGTVAGKATETKESRMQQREETLKLIERVRRIVQNPGLLPEETRVPFFDAQQAAPRLASTMMDKAYATAAYLFQHIPVIYKDPFNAGTPPMYDEEKMAAFERRAAVAKDPMVCFDALASENMTVEHAEALKQCWPALYAQAQERVVQELADAKAEGRDIPFDARINIGTWLGVVTDQSLLPIVYAAIQAVHQLSVQQPEAQPLRQYASNSEKASTKSVSSTDTAPVSERMQRGVGDVGA